MVVMIYLHGDCNGLSWMKVVNNNEGDHMDTITRQALDALATKLSGEFSGCANIVADSYADNLIVCAAETAFIIPGACLRLWSYDKILIHTKEVVADLVAGAITHPILQRQK